MYCTKRGGVSISPMSLLRWRVLRQLQDRNTPFPFVLPSNKPIQQKVALSTGRGGKIASSQLQKAGFMDTKDKTKGIHNHLKSPTGGIDVERLLSNPHWSVESLLPPANQSSKEPSVTVNQLHHLLRLSALPKPKSKEEESEMVLTLSSQLHFVKDVQSVDTSGVEPMRAIRDETVSAENETEITLATLRDALAQEEIVGKYYKRIRRRQLQPFPPTNPEGWRPLDHAQSKVGKYFVVDSGQKPLP
jgi:Asp-tRNA(Asn)/Glu-tRNA(Gln) amidotransferase C subunit